MAEEIAGVQAPAEALPVEPTFYIGSSTFGPTETLPNGLIRVKLNDPSGTPPVLDFTPEQFEAVKSLTPYEDVRISIKKWNMFIAKTILLLMENHMQMGDLSFVLMRLKQSIEENFNIAVGKKFEVADQDYITLQQVYEVLKSN